MTRVSRPILNSAIMILVLISFFLDSYYFFLVGNYCVTVFTLALLLVISDGCVSVFKAGGHLVLEELDIITLIFCGYIILNTALTGIKNITSPIYILSFFFLFFFARRTESLQDAESRLILFVRMIDITAIYGIYQFFARIMNLPLGDLIWKGHMREGYVWTLPVHLLGRTVYRSNAVFLEPSFFSQFLAIAILFHVNSKISGKDYRHIFWSVIDGIAFFLTVSGTGIIVLIIGEVIFLFLSRDSGLRIRTIILAAIGLVGIIVFYNVIISSNSFLAQIMKILIRRTREFSASSKNLSNRSGYIRFVEGFKLLSQIWRDNPLSIFLGNGMGSADMLGELYGGVLDVNGYVKILCDLGVLGLVLYFVFLFRTYKGCRDSQVKKLVFSTLIPIVFCHEGFMQNYDWIILVLLNSRNFSVENER